MTNIRTTGISAKGDMLYVDVEITPVQPVQYINVTTTIRFEKKTWQETLSHMYMQNDCWSTFETMFREKFSGDYVIKEFYNAKLQRFDVRLNFATPEAETMFLLRWS